MAYTSDATMVVGEKNKQPSTNTMFARQSTDSLGGTLPVQSTIQSHYSLSDSFWEIGQFKRSVKRIEDGVQACNQLMQMVIDEF
jgi:prophage tail gpP-like protein